MAALVLVMFFGGFGLGFYGLLGTVGGDKSPIFPTLLVLGACSMLGAGVLALAAGGS